MKRRTFIATVLLMVSAPMIVLHQSPPVRKWVELTFMEKDRVGDCIEAFTGPGESSESLRILTTPRVIQKDYIYGCWVEVITD